MAYISVKTIKEMRQEIRKKFPAKKGWKWSVTTMNENVGVTIALLQYPHSYKFPENLVFNHYAPDSDCDNHNIGEREKKIILKAQAILMKYWKGNASSGEMNYFPSLRIGTWNRKAVPAPKSKH